MNTQFKILWFEDSPTWYKTAERQVKTTIKTHYLEPVVNHQLSGEVLNIDELKSAKYDLILMDYKLPKNSPRGDEIIENVRKNLILTDILFYSSEYEKMVTAFKEKIPEIDGVYLAKRDIENFPKKIEGLVSKIVQRSEDIVNLRGLVLEATSFFETKTQNFITELWNGIKPEERDDLDLLYKKKILDHRKKEAEKNIEKFNQKELNAIKANENGLTMNERLALLDAFSKQNRNGVILNALESDIQQYYRKKLGGYRNKLGHLEIGQTVKIDNKEEKIDQEFHRKMRRNIAELKNNFESSLKQLF